MEGLTRLVSESLARHGFDRPLDYRRLHWSRWFRCESPHSLLQVPSKPGVFALAEEMMDFGRGNVEERALRPASPAINGTGALAPVEAEHLQPEPRRMLAVTQFFEDDDMAFVLDRMLSRNNPMRARLTSGRYFVRFVVIEDEEQRQSICAALNQWIVGSAEKATGIGSHFASSLELTPEEDVGRTLMSANADAATAANTTSTASAAAAPQLDSGAATNIHCPSPLPSGF
jgi:hypothetical protein